jgi:hypothetical protein
MIAAAWILLISLAQSPASAAFADVTAIRSGAPVVVAQLDLGKLKGEMREMSWSPDGSSMYLKVVDGRPPSETLRHYLVGVVDGAVTVLDAEPEWAGEYWRVKSDRMAPGIGSIQIDVDQKIEKTKVGTGSARPGTMTTSLADSADNAAMASEGQRGHVIRLTLYDHAVSEFADERPVPGLMFSWGPMKTGSIAYTTRKGELLLLDRQGRTQLVAGAKDAVLPAWSLDGYRLAWLQKAGRKKFALVWVTLQ